MLLIGGSLLFYALRPMDPTSVGLGFRSHRSSFGSSGIGNVGWLMPPNTLISTSYVANVTLSGFIEATLNVFPYQIKPGTALHLGLYLNGRLSATQDYDLSGNYTTPATILGPVDHGVANFSNSLLGFTVSDLPLGTTFPPGTTMTVTAWASNPIWVQVDTIPLTKSYETFGMISYSAPSLLIPDVGIISPRTLSVGLESSAR